MHGSEMHVAGYNYGYMLNYGYGDARSRRGAAPAVTVPHARTVTSEDSVAGRPHIRMRSTLEAQSSRDSSVPSQLTAASATGRRSGGSASSTCTAGSGGRARSHGTTPFCLGSLVRLLIEQN